MIVNAGAEAVLATLERRAKALDLETEILRASASVRLLRNFTERLPAQRYAQDRATEELTAARQACLVELRAVDREIAARMTTAAGEAVEEHDTARRKALTEGRVPLGSVVDLAQLRTSSEPAEILELLADAADVGDAATRAQAERIARTRLIQLATDEQKKHQLGGAAFRALCSIPRALTGATTAESIRARYAQRAREGRDVLLQVAAVVGLDQQLSRELKAAHARPLPTDGGESRPVPGLVFGKYWESGARR